MGPQDYGASKVMAGDVRRLQGPMIEQIRKYVSLSRQGYVLADPFLGGAVAEEIVHEDGPA